MAIYILLTAWVRYLDHFAQIDISHEAPYEQRERYNIRLYLRCVDENEEAPPLQQRPGHQDAKKASVDLQKQSAQDLEIPSSQQVKRRAYIISLILHCKDTLSGLALVGLKISQKNVLSHPPLLPAGHQVHPGGARLHGLQTGIRTSGKTVSGLKSGEIGQHRARVFNEVNTRMKKLVSSASNDRSEVVTIYQKA